MLHLTFQHFWVLIVLTSPPLSLKVPQPPLQPPPRPSQNSARIGDIWPASVCDRRWKDRKVPTTFTFSKTAFVCPYSWCWASFAKAYFPAKMLQVCAVQVTCKEKLYSLILSVPAQKSVKRTPHRQSDVSIGNAVMNSIIILSQKTFPSNPKCCQLWGYV